MEEPLKPKLKACPFCGGEAAYGKVTYPQSAADEHGWSQRQFHSVNCIYCGSSNQGIIGHRTQEEAAQHWNTRTVIESQRDLVEDVKGAG